MKANLESCCPFKIDSRGFDLLLKAESPKIFFTGLEDSGKSSLLNHTFPSVYSRRTHQPPSSIRIEEIRLCKIVPVVIIDIYGASLADCVVNSDDRFKVQNWLVALISCIDTIVFVMDAQNENLDQEISICAALAKTASDIDPSIEFNIFVHKMDGDFAMAYHAKGAKTGRLHDAFLKELRDLRAFSPFYMYQTSIHDYSAARACSSILTRQLPILKTITRALEIFKMRSCLDRAYLVDLHTKVLLATDMMANDNDEYQIAVEGMNLGFDLAKIYHKPESDLPTITNLILLEDSRVLFIKAFEILCIICDTTEFKFNQPALVTNPSFFSHSQQLEHNTNGFVQTIQEFLKTSTTSFLKESSQTRKSSMAKRITKIQDLFP